MALEEGDAGQGPDRAKEARRVGWQAHLFRAIDADGIFPSVRNNPSGSVQPGRVDNDGVIQAFAPASSRSAGNLAW